jgi:hypothetical protein
VPLQNDTSSFITYTPVPTPNDDENSTKAEGNPTAKKKQGEVDAGMEREAAQLFHALWLAMREQRLLAVGTYKGAAAWRPHPVALVVQEEEFADSGEQVQCLVACLPLEICYQASLAAPSCEWNNPVSEHPCIALG